MAQANRNSVRGVALAVCFLLHSAQSMCPNGCSGHGTCGQDDVCTCYQDWGAADALSGDCSQRYCPHEIAWVGSPDASGNFHRYLECGGRGVCDRASGECQCFDGFTGKGCQREVCPGEVEDRPGVYCNGHGSCEFVEELGYGSHPGQYYDGSVRGLDGLHSTGVYDSMHTHFPTQAGHLWERRKHMQCVCDAMYTGPDCSLRPCARGNDINHHRLDPTDDLKYYIQNVTIFGAGPWGNGSMSALEDFYNHSFALTFTTHLNESYTTQPIKIADYDDITDIEDTLASDIAVSLMALPHQVIDKVIINVTMGYQSRSEYHIGNAFDTRFNASVSDVAFIHFTALFTGKHNHGDQKLLTVKYKRCLFCTPQLGVDGQLPVMSVVPEYSDSGDLPTASFVSHLQSADWNNYECGRRGKCDFDTGLCDCFDGYVGDACGIRNELV